MNKIIADAAKKNPNNKKKVKVTEKGARSRKKGTVISRDLLEPALAMLTLVAHPALVADTGGVDTMTREAGDFVAGLGLGHLGIESQVQEAVEEQPAVHIQEREEAAAAGGGKGSPDSQGRGGCCHSPRRAAQLHLRRGGHGPRRGQRRAAMAEPLARPGQKQLPPRTNNPAREIQTPRFLLAFLSSLPPLPTPALPSSGPFSLLRPVTPEGKPSSGSSQPSAPSLRRPPQGSSLPSSSMEKQNCLLTLCFLLARYAPHRRAHTPAPPSSM